MKRFNLAKGSATLEAAIIYPIVLLCILALIYISMFYYHILVVKSSVNECLQNATYLKGYDVEKMSKENRAYFLEYGITDVDTLCTENLYWQLNMFDETMNSSIIDKVTNKVQNKSLFLFAYPNISESIIVVPEYRNYILFKKITIKAYVYYKNPFGKALRIFGCNDYLCISTYNEALIRDPKDFINNTDFLYSLFKQSNVASYVEGKISDIKSAIKNYFN